MSEEEMRRRAAMVVKAAVPELTPAGSFRIASALQAEGLLGTLCDICNERPAKVSALGKTVCSECLDWL